MAKLLDRRLQVRGYDPDAYTVAPSPAQPATPASQGMPDRSAMWASLYPPAPPVAPDPGVLDYVEEGVRALSDLPLQAAAGVASTVEGFAGTPGIANPSFGDWVVQKADEQALERETRLARELGKDTFGGKMIGGGVRSFGMSLPGMTASLGGAAAGAFVPVPGASPTMSLAAGGTVAYKQKQYLQSMEYLKAENEKKLAATGQPLTEEEETQLLAQYAPNIDQSALSEAVPEAVGNLLTLGVAKSIFKQAAGEAAEAAAKTPMQKMLASRITKLTGAVAGEVATESVTRVGEEQASRGTLLEEQTPLEFTPSGLLEAGEQVLPAVLGTMGLVNTSAYVGGKVTGAVKDSRAERRISGETGVVAKDVAAEEGESQKQTYQKRATALFAMKRVDPDLDLNGEDAQVYLRTGRWGDAPVNPADVTGIEAALGLEALPPAQEEATPVEVAQAEPAPVEVAQAEPAPVEVAQAEPAPVEVAQAEPAVMRSIGKNRWEIVRQSRAGAMTMTFTGSRGKAEQILADLNARQETEAALVSEVPEEAIDITPTPVEVTQAEPAPVEVAPVAPALAVRKVGARAWGVVDPQTDAVVGKFNTLKRANEVAAAAPVEVAPVEAAQAEPAPVEVAQAEPAPVEVAQAEPAPAAPALEVRKIGARAWEVVDPQTEAVVGKFNTLKRANEVAAAAPVEVAQAEPAPTPSTQTTTPTVIRRRGGQSTVIKSVPVEVAQTGSVPVEVAQTGPVPVEVAQAEPAPEIQLPDLPEFTSEMSPAQAAARIVEYVAEVNASGFTGDTAELESGAYLAAVRAKSGVKPGAVSKWVREVGTQVATQKARAEKLSTKKAKVSRAKPPTQANPKGWAELATWMQDEGFDLNDVEDTVGTTEDAVRLSKEFGVPVTRTTNLATALRNATATQTSDQRVSPTADLELELDTDALFAQAVTQAEHTMAIASGATALEVAQGIAQRSPTSTFAQLLPAIQGYLQTTELRTATTLGAGVRGRAAVSNLDATSSIELHPTEGMADETISHEMVHVATLRALRLGLMQGNNTVLGRAARDIDTLFVQLKARIETRMAAGTASPLEREMFAGTNMFDSSAELISWGLTDPVAQGWLKSLRVTEKQSFFQRLAGMIKRLLGYAGDQDAFERLLASTNTLLSVPAEAVVGELRTEIQALYRRMDIPLADYPMALVDSADMREYATEFLRKASNKAAVLTTTTRRAVQDMFDPQGRKRWSERISEVGIPNLPLNSMVDLLGDKMPYVKEWGNEMYGFTAAQNGKVNEFMALLQPLRGRLAQQVPQFNRAALTSSYYQMIPWKAGGQQDWVPTNLRGSTLSTEALAAADRAWADANMPTKTGKTFSEAYKESREAYDAIPSEETKQIYEAAVLQMRQTHFETIALVRQQIGLVAGGNKERAIEMERLLLPPISAMRGAYWPLSRFGKFALVMQPKGDTAKAEYSYQLFESQTERDIALFQAARDPEFAAKFTIYGTETAPLTQRSMAHVPHEFVEKMSQTILDRLTAAGVPATQQEELTDALGQLWLQSMPETSALKASIRRKTVAGYGLDGLRGGMSYMMRSANRLAEMRHGKRMEQIIRVMRDEAQERVKEDAEQPGGAGASVDRLTLIVAADLENRLNATRMEGSNALTRTLTKLASVTFMFSPSAYLVQLSQPLALGVPRIAADLYAAGGSEAGSVAKGFKAIVDAYGTVIGNRAYSIDRLVSPTTKDPDILAARQLASVIAREEDSLLAETQRADIERTGRPAVTSKELAAEMTPKQLELASILEALRTGALSATMTNESMDLATGREGAGITRGALWFMKMGEEHSRLATYLAALRVKMSQGNSFMAATDYAKDVTSNTMFVYDKPFKPAWLQQAGWRAVTQFKYYQLATIAKSVVMGLKATKGMTPTERAQARAEIRYMAGMSVMLGGLYGSLPGGLGLFLYQLFQGDEDEPRNVKAQLEQSMQDEPLWGAVSRGAFGVLGADVSGRVGMASTFMLDSELPASLHGTALAEWVLSQAAGAGWSVIGNFFEGYDKMVNEGDIAGGLAAVMPKMFKDAHKAYTLADEGLKTSAGKVIAKSEGFDFFDVAMMSVGIMPTEMSAALKMTYGERRVGVQLTERKQKLIREVVQAQEQGDREEVLAAVKNLEAFATKNPGIYSRRDINAAFKNSWKKQEGVDSPRETVVKRLLYGQQ